MTTAEHASSAAAPQDLRSIPFTPLHLPAALRLSEQVGWPHRVEDWELNLSLSDGVAVMEGEDLVGTAFCTRFGDVALLNMIIVDERRRGRGLGRRVMEEAIALAGGREMRLVATPEGMPLYRKLGFVSVGQIAQYQGVALGNTPELPVSPGRAEDADRLTAMDRDATGMERGKLLRRIAGQGRVLLAEGGFAMLRDFGKGHVLGPVVARDEATARALIAEGARRCADGFLRIDIPQERGLSDFVASLGLAHVGGGTTMTCPATTPEQNEFTTFALVSQALG
ncbi:GNAT family N-acetyltransferase [Paracoccus onubensis]|uniref:GNAT family N-acetyltransferase n=1 Tax=Paracoccus onubensis TaxID=1675788 RepID=UPI0027319694|nr:GNAT family N-acetyltransferase [Paracoccus onubensis]MDP0927178.1 GNAT family N-acetyltransferase [Paracoccus onubensis]